MAKKMYVIQAADGMFFCGLRYWDKQLRKAKIYHSLAYARDVVDAYEENNCKIVEVSLEIMPEVKTNADRIRAMSDEELAHFMVERNINESTLQLFDKDYALTAVQIESLKQRLYCACMQWLKQPAEGE